MTTRKFKGNVPPPPSYLLSSATINGQRWALYVVLVASRPEHPDWQSMKLIADGRAAKANYWFGWNVTEERLAHVPDVTMLKDKEPQVYIWVETVLRDGVELAATIYGS